MILSYDDFTLFKSQAEKAWFFYMRELAMLKKYA